MHRRGLLFSSRIVVNSVHLYMSLESLCVLCVFVCVIVCALCVCAISASQFVNAASVIILKSTRMEKIVLLIDKE